MSKSTNENLHQIVDILADEIGDGTLLIERDGGKDYALISKSYFKALERKAEAYDHLVTDPDEADEKHEDLLRRLDDAQK